MKKGFRCGFVAVCGRPNAGKSTLVNRLVGEEVSIVTPKAQTTRNRITGIRTTQTEQLVFLDLPGLIDGASGMNEYLAKTARSSMGEADVVLYLVDVSAKPDPLDTTYVTTLIPEGAVAILALNKTDRLKNKAVLLPMIRSWDALGIFSDIFPISAATGEGVGDLEKALREAVPEGEALYPADQWSEMPEKFFAAEIIRESLFNNLREELPYSSAVDVEVFDESARSDDGGLVRMIATIHVERNSQKGMVIGRGGQMLKKIGTEARERLAAFLGSKVYLELHVVVSKNWTKNESELKKLGYFARES